MEVLVRELKCNNSVIERSASCLNVPSVLCRVTASEGRTTLILIVCFVQQPGSRELCSGSGAKLGQTFYNVTRK